MLLLKLKQHYLDTEVADSIETDQLPTTKIVNFKLTIKKIDIEFLKHKTKKGLEIFSNPFLLRE